MRRSGFTLFELLLVLALAVVVMSIAISTMRGPLATQRLHSAAGELRSEMCRVRNRAVRSGATYVLSLQPQSGTVAYGVWTGGVGVGLEATSGAIDVSDASPTNFLTFSLPEGIVVQQAMVGQLGNAVPADLDNAAQQLFFFPDGTSTDALLTLVNDEGVAIAIELTGITCSCRVGSTFVSDTSSSNNGRSSPRGAP